MNILTNGARFVHADVDRKSLRLTYSLSGEHEGSSRSWWGRLEAGDEVVVGDHGPRVELLDEMFRPLARDLRGRLLRLRRSGVIHLRIHGAQGAELHVTRTASWFSRAGAGARGQRSGSHVWKWLARRALIARGPGQAC